MRKTKSNVIYRLSSDYAEQRSFYRFYRNKRVKMSELISHIVSPVHDRVSGRHVLVIGDTTAISLKARIDSIADGDRLGVLSDNKTPGFHLHAHLAIDAETGAGLGLSDLILWNRMKRETSLSKSEKQRRNRLRKWEEKESYRWYLGMKQSQQVLADADKITYIFDREADFTHLWDASAELQVELLVRMWPNWAIDHPEATNVLTYLDSCKVAGRYELALSKLSRRNYSQSKAQKRTGRTTGINVRFGQIFRKALTGEGPTWVVEAKEDPAQVPQGEDPVHWVLLTSHPVESFEDAIQIIRWYESRWLIEQLFRVSKRKGFDLEASELGDLDAIFKQTLTTFEAAFQVMQLLLARGRKDAQPLTDLFSPEQIRCLRALNRKYQGRTVKQQNPYPPDRLSWASWIIGRLGGWKGLPSQKPPGPITLKRGVEKYYLIFEGWKILTLEEDMYNP